MDAGSIIDPKNKSLMTLLKQFSGPWSSCEVRHNLTAENLNHLCSEYKKIQRNTKWRVLLALLTLEQEDQAQLGESISNLLNAADGDEDQWVTTVAALVRRWLYGADAKSDMLEKLMEETMAEIAKKIEESVPQNDGMVEETPYFEPMELAFLRKELLPQELQSENAFDNNPHFEVDLDALERLTSDEKDGTFRKR